MDMHPRREHGPTDAGVTAGTAGTAGPADADAGVTAGTAGPTDADAGVTAGTARTAGPDDLGKCLLFLFQIS